MSEIPRKTLFLVLILFLAGCQNQGASFSQADLDASEAEVAVQLESFWDAWGAVAFDEGMAFYSDDPNMTFVNDGFVWESKAATGTAYRPFFDALERQEVNVTETRIFALTPEIVHAIQAVTFVQHSKDGNVTPPMESAISFTWVKGGGTWKALTYHFSVPNPAPVTRKSVSLFNLASGADEAALVEAVTGLNAAIGGLGLGDAGYGLWKVAGTQNPDAVSLGFDFMMVGNWPDQAVYDEIHAAGAYLDASEAGAAIFDRVLGSSRYSRFDRIDVGGPGGM